MRSVIAMLTVAIVSLSCGATSTPSAAVSPTLTQSPSATASPHSYPGLWPRSANLAYDSTRGTVVLFGGLAATVGGDTWIWQNNVWTMKTPSANPSARQGAVLVDDPEMHAVLLFGGEDASGGSLGDTWAWNGADWSRLQPAHSPPARSGAAGTFDPVHHVVLLFSGSGGLDDTWIWNGQDWSQASPAQSPPARTFGRLAVDASHAQAVLFGGFGALSDTWLWDGATWTEQHPNNTPPGFQEATPFASQMVYDSARHVVMFVGPTQHTAQSSDDTMDTWAWNGSDWTHVVTVKSPPARDGSGLAYDATNSIAVLAGGFPLGGSEGSTTWSWDGTDWAPLD